MSTQRPWRAALGALLALAPFFFVTYGFAGWVTSLRGDAGSMVFGWEVHIPFVPWTIIPYWSTDFLYAISLFLCASRPELNILVRRLVAVQVLSVAGFLLFPLRFSFERPPLGGSLGWLFGVLGSFDRPFNQAPSLHIGITVVLWAAYGKHLTGWPWRLMRGWMILTGLSTLTTYQHHFIDLPTGLWTGLLAAAMVPDRQPAAEASVRNSRTFLLSAAYLLGFALLATLAWRIEGTGWLLLWPAGSMLLVAAIYARGKGGLFGKRCGAMDPALRALLAPYLWAAWLNSRLWTRATAPAEIRQGLWLGRVPRRAERDRLGIGSVVDLSAELPVNARGVAYRHIPVLDLVVPTARQLDEAVAAIEASGTRRPTLVCCALGYSRSAMAVAAWLLAQDQATTVDQVLDFVRSRQPRMALDAAHRCRLLEWSNQRRNS